MTREALARINACPLAVDARGSSVRVVIAADKYTVAHISTGINDREEYARLIAAAPDLLAQLRTAVSHIEHMAAWVGKQNAGYVFESLGEDMPGIRAAIAKAAPDQVRTLPPPVSQPSEIEF